MGNLVSRAWGRPGNKALNPQRDRRELEIEIEKESDCGEERKSREIRRIGALRKKTWKTSAGRGKDRESLPPERTRALANHQTTVQPLAVSIQLQHETKTKHSGTRGHTVETPSNGHARNCYEANEGKTKPHNTHNCWENPHIENVSNRKTRVRDLQKRRGRASSRTKKTGRAGTDGCEVEMLIWYSTSQTRSLTLDWLLCSLGFGRSLARSLAVLLVAVWRHQIGRLGGSLPFHGLLLLAASGM